MGPVFDTLYHISRVGDEVCLEAQVALLDELDLAAVHSRDVAIMKRGCNPTAHLMATGSLSLSHIGNFALGGQ